MITDLNCIQLINQAYYGGGTFDQSVETDYVKVFVKEYDDCRVIIFPGSESFIDWCRDGQADMRLDPDLGQVEWGFQQGMRDVCAKLRDPQNKPTIVTGHSLGAARALIFGGLLAVNGAIMQGDAIITFGSPRPGGAKLKQILSGVTQRSYRNCKDPVCSVPFYIPWFRPYQHPSPLIQVTAQPPANDPWGEFAEHHSTLYQTALENLHASST